MLVPARRQPLSLALLLAAALLGFAVLGSAAVVRADDSPAAWGSNVTEFDLPNGLRVIAAPAHAVPIVAVDAWVKAGTRREKQPGVAHYLEHVLFTGTSTRPSEEQIDGAIEDLGGSLDGATSYDWAHFFTVLPSAGFDTAVGVLADVLQHATLTSAAVEDERPIIQSEIARADGDPETVLANEARTMIYGPDTAYGRAVTGTAADVKDITRDEIAEFYKTYYVPNNITLVVAGDVTVDEVKASAERYFSAWRHSALLPPDVAPAGLPWQVRQRVVRHEENQSYLVMAFHAPAVSDQPDAWVMDVLLTLLGQGPNNRLDLDLHTSRHLVNSIEADYLTQHDPGILTVTASLPSGNLDVVQSGVLAQVKLLGAEPVSDDDLGAAKRSLKSSYLFDVETDSGHADSLGFYDCIDSYRYDTDYLTHIDSVTAAQVQHVAQKYLTADSYASIALVPPAEPESAGLLTTGQPTMTLANDNVNVDPTRTTQHPTR